MRRQIIIRAAGEALQPDPPGYLDPGSSPYPWENTPSIKLHEAWNDSSNDTYAYCWPGVTPSERHSVTLEKPPTLAQFNKVTLETGFDYAQAGGNPWWFPTDNDHGPGCALMMRKRDLTTYLVGTGAAAHQFTQEEDNNVNTNTSPVPFKLYTLTWEMLYHPEGGPWTFADLRDGAFGVEFNWSSGPNGKAFETAGSGFHKIRCPYLKITLDVEDLGGYTDNVRYLASLNLRLMRRARNVIKPDTLPEHAAGRQGSRVYFSHPRGPAIGGHGWGTRRLEGRDGLVLKRTYLPEAIRQQDEVLDMRPISCLLWGAYRIDCPWSPELQGLALLDKGRGFDHVRDQDSWSPRPGDGALMRVLADYPNLSSEGLAVSGGGDVSIALQNWDLMQAGWSTVASAGTFSAVPDLTVAFAEEQGYLSSCKLTYGAGGGKGGRERSLGTLPRADGDRVHVRVLVRNASVPSPTTQCGEWYLKRSGGGLAAAEYWNETGREWTTTPTYQAIPSDDPSGESVADAIPCDAAGATSDPTYVIGVGRFSANMGPVTLHGALVDVQHTDETVAGARPALVTLAAPLTRVADSHTMAHVWGRELWVHERGTAVVEVRPWWRAVDLPDGAVKPLLHAQHATDTYQALQFVAMSAGDDLIRWESAISGEATFQLDCPVTVDLTRAHILRAWARWLGADGWTQYGPFSVEVGYLVTLEATGAVVSIGSVIGRLASETAVLYARDHVAIGCDATRQADAHVRLVETRRSPLHGLECAYKV